jgi:hypothetical protein
MKTIPNFINEEGIYQPELGSPSVLSHKSLKYLIENDLVFQDENGDWILVEYSTGTTNSEDWFHWEKTGYKRSWSFHKWKHDTDLDGPHTCCSIETKEGWDKKYLTVKLNNHKYSRFTHPNGYWSETIIRTDICGGYGEEQLYYKDSLGTTSGKMPVKIGKKVQGLKDKGIEFGFYKF